MKRSIRSIFVILLIGIALLIYSTKDYIAGLFFSDSVTNETKNNTNVVKARDGIIGRNQPYPFITSSEGVKENLLTNSMNNLVGQYIYARRGELPTPQQKLLANNKDTTLYVLGYLTGDRVPFEQGETVELKRKYPYYIQWDRRWAYDELGSTDVAIGGCGPTCVAMAIGGLLNDESITPREISKIENENGYFTEYGTSWSFFDFIAKRYNLRSSGVKLNQNAINNVLKKGNPIIASVKPGKFTTVGHIILIIGVDEEGKYIINDPNSYGRTLKKWSYDELKTEIVSMWEFSK